MIPVFKKLILGLGLLCATSAILLLSDVSRRSAGSGEVHRVAVLQFVSSPLMEAGVTGIRAGLAAGGLTEGQNLEIALYNAEGDIPTANSIARQLVSGQFDLVVTSGTPAMQAVANANQDGKTVHVFGLVADPFGSGVGLKREDPLDHAPHFVGIGSLLPMAPVIEMARELYPSLKAVGIVWNPAESNSEIFTIEARKVCARLGIELLEAAVDNSAGVFEAANSLAARGAEALLMSGDNTVASAPNSILSAAKAARIPAFSILTGNAKLGALFELGANFEEVGRLTGALAARILQGTDPAAIPVSNIVPQMLSVNLTALAGLRDPWRVPQEVLGRADLVIDETGVHEKNATQSASAGTAPPLAKTWKIKVFSYVEAPAIDETVAGIHKGFDEAGLVKGRDYDANFVSAQGDIATASSMVDAASSDGTELIISLTTPMLQACLRRSRGLPVVFTLVANPVLAGAGKSNTEHMPNVAGNFVVSPFERMIRVVRQCMPKARRVGTLFAPAEVNSVFYRDKLVEAGRAAGIEVQAVGVSTASEVADAALSMGTMNIDAICQISDSLSGSTFAPIAQAARKFRLPLFTFNTTHADQGSTIIVARDYYDGGRQAGLMAARVMRGESPARMPFEPVEKEQFIINLDNARKIGLTVPRDLIAQADKVIGN
jgi:ABC-type uncharacterized transport system substrate-binding protein